MLDFFMPILMAITFSAKGWTDTVPVVVYGMLGIFIVIGVIVLVTYLLNKLTSNKKNNKDDK